MIAPGLKIALLGNIANNFFREAYLLRGESINVDCFISSSDLQEGRPSNPTSDFEDAEAAKFFWIKKIPYEKFSKISRLLIYLPSFFNIFMCKEAKKFLKDLSAYDINFYSSSEILLLPHVKNIGVIRPTGSDLTISPVLTPREFRALRPHVEIFQRNKIKKKILDFIFLTLNRRAYMRSYKKAKFVINSRSSPYVESLKRMKISSPNDQYSIPLAIDHEIFKKNIKPSEILQKYDLDTDAFLVFLPSRIMIKNSKLHQATGQWKASDTAIRGFYKFLMDLPEEERIKTFLMIPDRTLSDDLELAKKLISELKINQNVLFLKGRNESGLSRSEMIPIYSQSSVVLDDFGAGWYGSVVVEALACECPVITFLTPYKLSSFLWHPFLIAKSENEIASQLHILHNDSELKNNIGQKSREWSKIYHATESVFKSYNNIIEYVLK
jgi:glycosyltransferase involved in cell wall biosynthesis